MLNTLFAKPTRDLEQEHLIKEAEDALHQRTNRLIRQNLKVDFSRPPPKPTPPSPMAKARALLRNM